MTTFAPQSPKPSKGPKILITLGGIALVIAVILGVVGAVLVATGASNTIKDASKIRDGLEVEIVVPGSKEVYLEAKGYGVVAIGDDLVRPGTSDGNGNIGPETRTEFPRPTVTVTSQDGTAVEVRVPQTIVTETSDDFDLVSVNSFNIDTAGTYVVAVTGEAPVTAIGVGDTEAFNLDGFSMAIGGGAVLIFSMVIGGPGLLALIVGVVWLLIDRSNQKGSAAGPANAYPSGSFGPPTFPPPLPPPPPPPPPVPPRETHP